MMRALLLSLSFLLPVLAFSQKEYDPDPVLSQVVSSKGQRYAKAVTDTIFPAFFDLPCSDTAQIFSLANDGGFVMGTNAFGDLAKGQRFVYQNDGPFLIESVNVAFAFIDSSALDSSVVVQIFNDPQAGGEFLGTSDSVLVRDLLLNSGSVDFTPFNFSDSIVVENDSFMIVVDMSSTYTENSTYMAIFQSNQNCGDGSNAFEFFITQDNTVGFGTIAANWNNGPDEPLNSEMFAFVTVENELSTSTRNPVANYSARVAPNPTAGPVRIDFSARIPGDYRATLTDLNGRNLFDSRISDQSGPAQFSFDLADLPTGLYLYHIDGPEGRQTGKLIKR